MTTEKHKTKLIKCVACKGKKDLVGLGFTTKKCGACAGIGYQEEVIDPIGYLEEQENSQGLFSRDENGELTPSAEFKESIKKLGDEIENSVKEEKKRGRKNYNRKKKVA